MPSAKGVTEVLVKLADGSVVTIKADPAAGLQAVYFDVAAAIAAGIPMSSSAPAGVTVTTKKATQLDAAGTMMPMDTTTDTTVCYLIDGKLVCFPA